MLGGRGSPWALGLPLSGPKAPGCISWNLLVPQGRKATRGPKPWGAALLPDSGGGYSSLRKPTRKGKSSGCCVKPRTRLTYLDSVVKLLRLSHGPLSISNRWPRDPAPPARSRPRRPLEGRRDTGTWLALRRPLATHSSPGWGVWGKKMGSEMGRGHAVRGGARADGRALLGEWGGVSAWRRDKCG